MKYLRVLLTLTLLCGLASGLPSTEGLTDLAGQPVNAETSKNLELVVFWATWCPTCKEKLTGLLPKLNADKNISVITINTDKDADRVKHYIEKEKIALPVLWDTARTLRKDLKAFSVPHWAVYRRAEAGQPWNLVDSAPAFEISRVEKALGIRMENL